MQPLKIIVEKHTDGYVAYPLGLKGVVMTRQYIQRKCCGRNLCNSVLY